MTSGGGFLLPCRLHITVLDIDNASRYNDGALAMNNTHAAE